MSYLSDGQYSRDGVLPYQGTLPPVERARRDEVINEYTHRCRPRFCIDSTNERMLHPAYDDVVYTRDVIPEQQIILTQKELKERESKVQHEVLAAKAAAAKAAAAKETAAKAAASNKKPGKNQLAAATK